MLEEINSELPETKRISLTRFKEIMKEQFLILMQEPERAVAAIPMLLPASCEECNSLLGVIRQVANSDGTLSQESKRGLARIETLFDEPKLRSLPLDAVEEGSHVDPIGTIRSKQRTTSQGGKEPAYS